MVSGKNCGEIAEKIIAVTGVAFIVLEATSSESRNYLVNFFN